MEQWELVLDVIKDSRKGLNTLESDDSKTLVGAVVQLCSKLDFNENLKTINHFIRQAKSEGAAYIFLPEAFYSMSDGLTPTPYLISEGNEHYQNLVNLARDNSVTLVGGSCAVGVGNKIFNRAYIISSEGKVLSYYDKKNLFKCKFKSQNGGRIIDIDEGRIYSKGQVESTLFSLNHFWKVGLSICFDIRFGENYSNFRSKGANLICIPSAFTKKTGKLHWHTLVKARAIETQSFVVAAAQVGNHNDKVSTYGHSLVVNPMGKVLCDLGGEKEGYEVFHMNFSDIIDTRSKIIME